jgi:SLOG in TRPM, prokaryote
MKRDTITFDNGNQAVVVTAGHDTDAQTILKSLEIAQPHALIMVFGGAKGLDDSRKTRLAELFTNAIAPMAVEFGVLVIDGGTQSGVMAMMGEALARDGRGSQLLGIAPAGKVTYPGHQSDANIVNGAPLEPNHSHFVLVDSDEWGGETGTMFKLAGAFNVAVVTMLINGGQIAGNEALQSVRNGWPVLVVEGSGRFADELSAAVRNGQSAKSTKVSEIARSGRVRLFRVNDSAEKLRVELHRILAAQNELLR